MNQSQIHLALTHLPVVLTITGMVMLFIALVRKNQSLIKTSFYILIAAALFTLPVFFSGEGAEEIVEELPGVSESTISLHESVAQVSLYFILATGLAALAGLFNISGKPLMKLVRFPVLSLAFASSIILAYTAHLGGQVRHTEMQTASIQNAGESNENTNSDTKNVEKENGDD